jgi:hypothetical protein
MTPADAAARGLPEDFKARFDAVGLLIRSGFKPQAALAAVELDPIEHYDLLPVTLQRPEDLLEEPEVPTGPGDDPDPDPEVEVDPDE